MKMMILILYWFELLESKTDCPQKWQGGVFCPYNFQSQAWSPIDKKANFYNESKLVLKKKNSHLV